MRLASMLIPYLLVVTLATTTLDDFGREKTHELNLSPYHGVVVPLIRQYDSKDYNLDAFQPYVAKVNMNSVKHIWPWIFFNRFVGYQEGYRAGSKDSSRPYFHNIKGMDLNDETGLELRWTRFLIRPGLRQHGSFEPRTRQIVIDAGYKVPFNSEIGRNGLGSDPYLQKRIVVDDDDSKPLHSSKLAGSYDWARAAQWAFHLIYDGPANSHNRRARCS